MFAKHLGSSVISMIILIVITNSAIAADIEAGRIKSTQCAICHGEDGEGNGAPKSKISGLDKNIFIKHLKDFRSGVRKNVMMERFVEKLSDQDIENLAAYYATK